MANPILPVLPPPLPSLNPTPALIAKTGREGVEPATVCLIQTYYLRNQGVIQVPVAGPPGTACATPQWCAPYGLKIVQWMVARNTLLPELPDYTALASLGETLAGWMIGPIAPGILIDGITYEFQVEGIFAFYLALPPDKSTGLAMERRTADSSPGIVLNTKNFSEQWRGNQ